MNRYQSHKIVEAGLITHFTAAPEGKWLVAIEGDDDPEGPIVLASEVGIRILKMAEEAGVEVVGGYLMDYLDGGNNWISWSPAEVFAGGYDLAQPSSGKSKIAGYRELTETEINNMNAVKEHGIKLGDLVATMRAQESPDQRWVALGATHLQQGLMALTRAIAKPDFF